MLRTLTHTIISLPLKLMVKSIVGLPFKGLLFAAVCLVTSHSLYAQSLTEQLEQGLGLSPAPQKPAAQSAPNTAKLPQSADDFLKVKLLDSFAPLMG